MKILENKIIDTIVMNIFPPIVAVIVALLMHFPGMDNERWFNVLSVLIGVFGTILGFMVAVVSVLLAFNDGRMIMLIKKTGHYKTILLTYMICCFHLFIALFISLAMVITDAYGAVYYKLECGLFTDSMVIVGVCLFLLYALIKRIDF